MIAGRAQGNTREVSNVQPAYALVGANMAKKHSQV